MNYEMKLTTSSDKLFSAMENNDLSFLSGNWGDDIQRSVSIPCVRDYDCISHSLLNGIVDRVCSIVNGCAETKLSLGFDPFDCRRNI